jgi:GT2 family glycosyltransferase
VNRNSHKIAVVVPTIGRNAELRRMLASLARQSRLPDEVIIVDEDESSRALVDGFSQLNIRVIVLPGSASAKRNAGTKAVGPDVTLVGFMDDDIVLEPAAIEAMAAFWEQAASGLAGASCNYVNAPRGFGQGLKRLAAWSMLGLYERRPGGVARSGFQTRMTDFRETTYVRWLPSGAAFYAREVLDQVRFDEWFENYSYLEDLDFSYWIGKKYKLAVVAGARFCHYPSGVGRPSAYLFGKKEVLNRLYFVSKHPELSRPLCCLALSIRSLMSLLLGLTRFEADYFKRTAGNFAGALSVLKGGWVPTRLGKNSRTGMGH